jgi:steroid delta-isomerase-like uncharacterized protein
MSTEQNKAIIRRLFEETANRGNLAVADELLASDYINYNFPTSAPGPQGFKQVITMFRAAFPDLVATLEDVIAEGDMVSTRGHVVGTHRGDFMGIPATGKKVSLSYIDIWRLENGKARENWVQMDMLGLMQQLGVVPGPGQTGA